MKKSRKCFRYFFLLALLAVGLLFTGNTKASAKTLPSKGTAHTWGRLSVKGTYVVNKKGQKVQLKGVSTHGIAWFPQYINQKHITSWRKMGANTIRVALYSDRNAGYSKSLYKKVDQAVKYATNEGMYVILDWHILSDGNPNTKTNRKNAAAFFTYMAKKYKNQTNIIYEICNEPNGWNVSWNKQIKPYAEYMIKLIRKYDKNGIIIVGTPTWSQDVDIVAKNPIKKQKNIMYALHFYAATHTQYLRDKVTKALKAKLPVFVSEFSICDASGNGSINYSQAGKWMSLIKKYKLPYVAWNISNKNETSALIKSSCHKTGTITTKDLSKSGAWLIKQFKTVK